MSEDKKEKRVWSYQLKEQKQRAKKAGKKVVNESFNPKSKENLIQYSRPKLEKEKEKIKKDIVKDPSIDIDEEMLEIIIPTKSIFSPEESKRFFLMFKLHIKELSENDSKLTVSDMKAVAKLCKNTILEDRLLEVAKKSKDGEAITSMMASIDKLNKDTEKLTEKLATDRKQRIDPRAGKDITVNDILFLVDEERQKGIDKLRIYKEEEDKIKDKVKSSIEEMIT